MKKFLPVLAFFILCFILVAPLVKAQNYDGPVFKERIPVDIESRSLDIRHSSVKWGGEKLVWVSSFNLRVHGYYSKRSPGVFVSTKTRRLISNNKTHKRR